MKQLLLFPEDRAREEMMAAMIDRFLEAHSAHVDRLVKRLSAIRKWREKRRVTPQKSSDLS